MAHLRPSLAHVAVLLAITSCLAGTPLRSGATATPPMSYAWREVGPPARSDHSAIYDPVADRMIIFGGLEGATAHNDVWALSLAGTPAWSRLIVDNVPPMSLSGHSAIYDPVRQRMIVFGGAGAGGSLRNECWALSLSGSPTWTPLSASNLPPSGRRGHTAIYDPVGDRMLIFGGSDGADRNEVWSLALGAEPSPVWSLLSPAGTPPSARLASSAIYDPVRQRMLVFGGSAGNTFYNDTWSLDLAGSLSWTQVTTSGTLPTARSYHSAVYDPVRDRMIVLGGGLSNSFYDVQALTLAGTPTWQSVFFLVDGTHAPAIYDPVRDRVLLHGGLAGLNCYSFTEAWTLSPSVTFARIPPTPAMPWPVSDAAGVYDPSQNRLVVAGGDYFSFFEPAYNQAANALALGSMQWALLGQLSIGRTGSSASYVSSGTPRMVMFGGVCLHLCSNQPFDEVWQLPLTPPGAWQQLAPTGTKPAGRSRHTSIYDPTRNSLIIFGGIGLELFPPVPRYNDVWELNLNGTPSWTQWTPLGAPPSARCGHSAIYDGPNQRMVVFGGRDAGGVLNDVWALSLTGTPTWTQLAPSGSAPSAREEHVGVHDATNQRLLVYGGINQTDLWALTLDGSPSWIPLSINGGPVPDAHDRLAAALDSQGVLWTFGGRANGVWKLMPDDLTAIDPRSGADDELFVAAAPNPAHRTLIIGFTLRDRLPARIDVFDLSGRRVESRDLEGLAAGFHRFEIQGSSRLPAGTYLVRLTQGSSAITTKAVLMH